jgi:hypothetical protein
MWLFDSQSRKQAHYVPSLLLLPESLNAFTNPIKAKRRPAHGEGRWQLPHLGLVSRLVSSRLAPHVHTVSGWWSRNNRTASRHRSSWVTPSGGSSGGFWRSTSSRTIRYSACLGDWGLFTPFSHLITICMQLTILVNELAHCYMKRLAQRTDLPSAP